MQLIYRGVAYESNPTKLEMVDTGITAKYRGRAYSVRSPRLPQEISSPLTLTYRGVSYSRTQGLPTDLETLPGTRSSEICVHPSPNYKFADS